MKSEIKQRIDQLNNGEIPDGYKKTDFGIFPCDWVTIKIGDVSITNGKYGINAPACEQTGNLPKYLRITDIDENGRYSDNGAFVDDKDSINYLLKKNDIVFARTGASVGKSYLYNENDGVLAYAGFLIKFSIDPNKCNPYLLKANCTTTIYDKWVSIMSARSGQPGINAEEYASYAFVAPKSVTEQKKIAEILMKWDKAIELQEKLIDKLALEKRSALQLCFASERCDTTINFADYIVERNERNKENNRRVKSISNMQGFVNQEEQFSKQVASENVSQYKIVKRNYVAYNPSRINVGSIAVYDEEEKGIISPMYTVFECVGIDPKFFLLLLNTDRGKYEIKSRLAGSVRDSLSFEELKDITMSVPNPERWQEILNVFELFDKVIQLEKDKLSSLTMQRKVLQQYLLNGIVRV